MAYRIARKKIALFCSAAGLATAGLTPTAALSQAASEEVASGDDLIVTANRRAEDVTKIPYNIAVLGGDQLAATYAACAAGHQSSPRFQVKFRRPAIQKSENDAKRPNVPGP